MPEFPFSVFTRPEMCTRQPLISRSRRAFSAICFHKPGDGSVLRLRRIPKPKVAVFPTHSSDTFPTHTYLVAEICSGLRLAYSAGKGSEDGAQRGADIFAELLQVGELPLKVLVEDSTETLRKLLRAIQREMPAPDVVGKLLDIEEYAFALFQDLLHQAGGVRAVLKRRGQFVALSLTSENATEVDRQFEVGKVPAKGSQTMTPEYSNTYTLTVSGPGGTNETTILAAFLEEGPEMPRRLDAWCLFMHWEQSPLIGQKTEEKQVKRW